MKIHDGRSDETRTETPNHAGWATFEARVRGRRFGRCAERAALALDLGNTDEARVALDEARTLSPDAPEIAELESRLGSASGPRAIPLSFSSPNAVLLAQHQAAVDSDPGWLRMSGGVAVLLVLFSVLGFGLAQRQYGWPDPLLTIGSLFTRAPNAVVDNETPPAVSSGEGTPAREVEQPDSAAATQAPLASAPTTSAELTRRPAAAPTVANRRPAPLPERSDRLRPVSEAPSRPAPVQSSMTLGRPGAADAIATSGVERARHVDEPAATTPSAMPAPSAVIPAVATVESSVVSIPTSALEHRIESKQAESERIRTVLVRYETAYNRLDAKAAGSVWPNVDQSALGRAFEGLITQRVSLGLCEITVIGNIGGASCAGKAKWEPKIGGGVHTEDRYWSFNLRKADDGWKIKEVRVR